MALFGTDYSLLLAGLRDGRWKTLHELNSGRSKLFDQRADAAETNDVPAQEAERAATNQEHLGLWV
jgi:hypothetical protein